MRGGSGLVGGSSVRAIVSTLNHGTSNSIDAKLSMLIASRREYLSADSKPL
jgi:hypothetical protein